ncbi:transporter substrate-binding protein [Kribbella sp. NPDC050124]|uniref:transporter substrate-binding protein n=1 Tax=Kribbella sp. NPDC050124 TaxID=3364114 RepID=UPI00379D6AD7
MHPRAGAGAAKSLSLTRRNVLRLSLLATAGAPLVAACGTAAGRAGGDGPITIGTIFDETGNLNVAGQAKKRAVQFFVDETNAAGGLLGRQLALKSYDAQSSVDKYTQYANTLAQKDRPDVVTAGITSASREAIRPIFNRNKALYLYGNIYEGGVCDKNEFIVGPVPSQQLQVLIPHAVKTFGSKGYIVAADYNYGQISATWTEKYIKEAGGEVLGSDFVPLESSDFGSIISKIQRARPDFVFTLMVGSNHLAFFRSFAAAGLKSSIPLVSSNFGEADEQKILTPTESVGVLVAAPYLQELENPANAAFVTAWQQKFGADAGVSDLQMMQYNVLKFWAAAVEKVKSTDHGRVVEALESGITIETPCGTVTMDGPSHHVTQPISIAKVNDKGGFTILKTLPAVPPSFEQEKCDLIANPTLNKAFVP